MLICDRCGKHKRVSPAGAVSPDGFLPAGAVSSEGFLRCDGHRRGLWSKYCESSRRPKNLNSREISFAISDSPSIVAAA